MRKHRKHRGYDKYHGDPQKASVKNYCAVDTCDMPAGFRDAKTKLCYRYRPCEKYEPLISSSNKTQSLNTTNA